MNKIRKMADRKSLKQKNLALFKKVNPALHDVLTNHKPSSTLVFDDDGEPDIMVDGKLLYDGRASEFAIKKIKAFRDDPFFYSATPPELGDLDRFGNQFLARVDDRARQDGIKFAEGLPPEECFFLIIFGIGLGKHIDALIESMDPYLVVFIEPDPDHFVHSAEVYPWHAFVERLEEKGTNYTFAINDDSEMIASLVLQLFRQISPAAIDGTPIF